MAPQRVPLKDQLFSREKVERIAGEIERVHPPFRADEFVRAVVARFPELELKARIDWIATCLEVHLPSDFRRAVGVLVRSLPAPLDPSLSDGDFGDFIYAPYATYVARQGCTAEDLEFSLAALREITTRFSAEFAIRPLPEPLPRPGVGNLAGVDARRVLPRTSAVQRRHPTTAPMGTEPEAGVRRLHPAPRPALRRPHALRHPVRGQPRQRPFQEGPGSGARHP